MPTVLMIECDRVVIYPNDHRPAHVHIIGGACEAVFDLHCPKGPPEVRENFGYSRNQIRRLKSALRARLERLCNDWEHIHGDA